MDDERDSRCRKILILRWYSLLIANNLSVENGTVTLNDHFVPIASAPSEARLCLLGERPSSGSPGKAPGTECCVSDGNIVGEAYTSRSWAAMRQREGIEPRDENKLWMPTLLVKRKAIPRKPTATASAGPPGSKTVARDQGKVGNSGDPIGSSDTGVGQYNQTTGRKLNGRWEVGCPHSSDEVE
jgi:hypothetical protein